MNELELFLELVEHMILNRIKENPKGGIKKSETEKMKYAKMLQILRSLKLYIYDWHGDRNYDICKDCADYKVDGLGTGYYGKCQNKNRDININVHEYHTCFRNTKRRDTP
jgi:hypothetical protein